jgi:hypothetical protein
MHTEKKMYVLVRRDLSDRYRFVQGMHALAQLQQEHPADFEAWHNTTICVLGVRNLIELRAWQVELMKKKYNFSGFFEPDLDTQITAIACYDDGLIFEGLDLA